MPTVEFTMISLSFRASQYLGGRSVNNPRFYVVYKQWFQILATEQTSQMLKSITLRSKQKVLLAGRMAKTEPNVAANDSNPPSIDLRLLGVE